ncbi:MAG: Lrp/AsnC ligand binding domain-containing protein [Nitrosopumilaceae archaeon]|jgi:DNA-binding Lrp family transcriptional regulator
MEKNAFVLVTCVPGEEDETQNILDKIPQIKKSSIVQGAYDIMIKIKASSMNELKELMWNIRHLPTVRATLTLNVDDQ